MEMVYSPTKPRGPVAAMYSGPGPCYRLPPLIGIKDHDFSSSHTKSPAYSFGTSRRGNREEDMPGPGYLPEAKLYRDGKEHIPAASICGKPRESKNNVSPGPHDYAVENKTNLLSRHSRQPAYTFGSSRRDRDADETPGPNKYVLPSDQNPLESHRRRAPRYTMVGRSLFGSFNDELSKRSPGPGRYNPVELKSYKKRPPAYTITGKHSMPGDNTLTPGPLDFKTEQVWAHKYSHPKFSFGIRHSQYEAPLIVKISE